MSLGNPQFKLGIEKPIFLSKQELQQKLENSFLQESGLLKEVTEGAHLPEAASTISAHLFFNLVGQGEGVENCGISVTTTPEMFVLVCREKLEQRIAQLGEENYSIKDMIYDFQIPYKDSLAADGILISSRKNISPM